MMLTVDDAYLFAAARRRALDAFEVLVRPPRVRAYRVALRMLREWDNARTLSRRSS